MLGCLTSYDALIFAKIKAHHNNLEIANNSFLPFRHT